MIRSTRSLIVALSLCAFALSANSQTTKSFETQLQKVRVTTIVKTLANPWGMAFLPDGRVLITERRGTMRVLDGGKLIDRAIDGLPKATEHGQGGLLDVVLHPKYKDNGWIYWTYNAQENGLHGTELARGKLAGSRDAPRMIDVQVLFKMSPKSDRSFHFGSRIVFDREGFLYVGFGDRGLPSTNREHRTAVEPYCPQMSVGGEVELLVGAIRTKNDLAVINDRSSVRLGIGPTQGARRRERKHPHAVRADGVDVSIRSLLDVADSAELSLEQAFL